MAYSECMEVIMDRYHEARLFVRELRHVFDQMFVFRRDVPPLEAYRRIWLYTKTFLAIIGQHSSVALDDGDAAGAIPVAFVEAMLLEDAHLRDLYCRVVRNPDRGFMELVLAKHPMPFTPEAFQRVAVEGLINAGDGSFDALEGMVRSLEDLLPTAGTPDPMSEPTSWSDT